MVTRTSWSKPTFRGSFSGGTVTQGSKSSGGGGGSTPTPSPASQLVPTPPPIMQPVKEEPKKVIVTLARKEGGGYTIEDVGGGLTPSQKSEVSTAIVTATTQARADQKQYETEVRAYKQAQAETRSQLTTVAPPSFVQTANMIMGGGMMTSAQTGRAVFVPSGQKPSVEVPGVVKASTTRTITGGRALSAAEQAVANKPVPYVLTANQILGGGYMTSAKTGQPVFVPKPAQKKMMTYNVGGLDYMVPEGSQMPGLIQAPFFTKRGQQERFLNMGLTLNSALELKGVTANVKNYRLKKNLEYWASNPYWAAFVGASGYGILSGGGLAATVGKGVIPKATTLLTSTLPKYALIGELTRTTAPPIIEAAQKRDVSVKRGYEEYGADVAGARRSGEARASEYIFGIQKQPKGATLKWYERMVTQQPWYKQAIYSIPGGELASGKSAQAYYEEGMQKYLKERGITGSAAQDITMAARAARISESVGGEIAPFLTTSATGEMIGRSSINQRLIAEKGTTFVKKGVFSPTLFKLFASEIAPIGFAEGFVQQGVQDVARGKEFSFKNNLRMGAWGFGSAGLLGGLIGGLAPVPTGVTKGGLTIPPSLKKKAPQKVVEFAANVVDPSEWFGDQLANFNEAATKNFGRVTGAKVPSFVRRGNVQFSVPVITSVPVGTFVEGRISPYDEAPKGVTGRVSDGTQNAIDMMVGNSGGSGGKSRRTTALSPFSISPSSSNKKATVNFPDIFNPEVVMGIPDDGGRGRGGGGRVSAPTSPVIPGDNDVTIPTSPNVPTPVDTTIPTVVDTGVPNVISTWVTASTPVYTPLIRFPPPLVLPPFGGLGSGGGGRGRGNKRSVYVDEVAAGRALLMSFMGSGQAGLPVVKKRMTKKEKKEEKKQKKNRKEAARIFDVGIDLPSIVDKPMTRMNSYMKFVPKIL